MILLKDRVYCPDHDHHSNMLEELGIKDDNPFPNFVKIEVIPFNGDVFEPTHKWNYRVDQDTLPEWYERKFDEVRVMNALKEWADNHILIGKNDFEIKTGSNYYIKNCKNVTAWENSTVTAWGNSTVTAWENSTVTARENSTVTARGNSTVKNTGSFFSKLYDKDTIILSDNATFKDVKTKTIYQSGDWKLVIVEQ